MWQKSKTGMWHEVGGTDGKGGVLATCQSYNLDRPNYLTGESVKTPPQGAKVCKKCASHKEDENA